MKSGIIVTADIDDYLNGLLPAREPLLAALEREAEERDFPIIGPQVGRMLACFAGLMGARHVFELGSGFGYSAFWFARAMAPGGRVTCTDRSEENAKRARDLFAGAGMSERLDFRVGDAMTTFEEERGPFDIVLVDLDKKQYPRALELAVERVQDGGLIVADNLLWSGRVLEGSPDADTRALMEYTRRAIAHPDLLTVVLPIRDGLGLSWRRVKELASC